MKAAKSVFFLCSSGMKPFFASSASRRSEMAISVGHFMSTPPSSVGKVCAGLHLAAGLDAADPRAPAVELEERLMLTAIA